MSPLLVLTLFTVVIVISAGCLYLLFSHLSGFDYEIIKKTQVATRLDPAATRSERYLVEVTPRLLQGWGYVDVCYGERGPLHTEYICINKEEWYITSSWGMPLCPSSQKRLNKALKRHLKQLKDDLAAMEL